MADKKTASVIEEKPLDPMRKVPVTLPRATGNQQNFVFVGLNGKGYKIMRGTTVMVPAAVADILNESDRLIDSGERYYQTITANAGAAALK